MIKGDLKISRWLLGPEMLLCFLPLTLLWLDGIDGRSGVLRLDRTFGTMFLIALVSGVILATIGPIALVAALRLIVWKRPIRNAWLRAALVAAPIIYGAMALLSRIADLGAAAFSVSAADAFDFWSGIVLLSALPALGAAHLLRLSTSAAGALPRSPADQDMGRVWTNEPRK